jgi:class 3 adenylate cyclase
VLISSATRELIVGALPADVALSDLGEHRLKDLDRPVHVFEVLPGDSPQASPAPHSASPSLT